MEQKKEEQRHKTRRKTKRVEIKDVEKRLGAPYAPHMQLPYVYIYILVFYILLSKYSRQQLLNLGITGGTTHTKTQYFHIYIYSLRSKI